MGEENLYDSGYNYPLSVIHDGDHGGDDFITTLVALQRSNEINLLGITTCHGNVSVNTATRNACLALDLFDRRDVNVFEGADVPWKIPSQRGDNAFGFNGLGGVDMGEPKKTPQNSSAQEYLANTIQTTDKKVNLLATGPLTNLAQLFSSNPSLLENVELLTIMGGCLNPLGPNKRQGNITKHAEFNFYMDPDAADFVLGLEIPTVLFPLDVTHQLVFNENRKQMARSVLKTELGEKLIGVMGAAENVDDSKFELGGAIFHDALPLLFLLKPELFRGKSMHLSINTDSNSEYHGQIRECRDEKINRSQVFLVDQLTDPGGAFEIILTSVSAVAEQNSRTVA